MASPADRPAPDSPTGPPIATPQTAGAGLSGRPGLARLFRRAGAPVRPQSAGRHGAGRRRGRRPGLWDRHPETRGPENAGGGPALVPVRRLPALRLRSAAGAPAGGDALSPPAPAAARAHSLARILPVALMAAAIAVGLSALINFVVELTELRQRCQLRLRRASRLPGRAPCRRRRRLVGARRALAPWRRGGGGRGDLSAPVWRATRPPFAGGR